jgi:hypothetical protein
MLTKEEIIEFRVALVRKEMTLKKWAENAGLDRGYLTLELNGHIPVRGNTETAIREFMKEYEKEVSPDENIANDEA